jgi:CheY-like chemotaxis protein
MKLLVHAMSLLNEHEHRYNLQHMTSKDPLATSGLPALDQNVSSPDGQTVESKFLILVVYDSADNVAVISLDLQQQNYRVVTASNGEDAVAIAMQMLPNLILMDINLPTLDGLGATRRIREIDALRDVPIVAITAFGTEGFQRAAYDAGLSGYLTKPIDFDRMHLLIARLLSPSASGSLTGQS